MCKPVKDTLNMILPLYQVDAFTSQVFGGNPAAVIPLEHWPDDALLQAIANENNLSETAYFVEQPARASSVPTFELRWFTPVAEVAMCGHATLASAHVLFKHLKIRGAHVCFETKSGELTVKKCDDSYEMNFPAVPSQLLAIDDSLSDLIQGLGIDKSKIVSISTGTDYLVELADQQYVEQLTPDASFWMDLGVRGVIVTAKGEQSVADFVSRCFYPEIAVPEDPVTGSAHCQLTPFWADKLNKTELKAVQLSKRRGDLTCKLIRQATGDRVQLVGKVADYMVGNITV